MKIPSRRRPPRPIITDNGGWIDKSFLFIAVTLSPVGFIPFYIAAATSGGVDLLIVLALNGAVMFFGYRHIARMKKQSKPTPKPQRPVQSSRIPKVDGRE